MAMRAFDSEYPDWGITISDRMPDIKLHPDQLQFYANFMIFVAILGCIPLSVQAYRIYQTGETLGVSVYAFSFQILLSTLWIIYGIISRIGVIVLSSTLILLAALILVSLTIYYNSNNPNQEDDTNEEDTP